MAKGKSARASEWRKGTTPSSAGSRRATPLKESPHVVLMAKCRPSAREKISVVPLDNASGHSRSRSSFTSPRNNTVLGSFLSSFPWRSPRLSTCSSSGPPSKEEDWRLVVADLSNKLIIANRKKDEALSEASRLNSSMSELEKKLTRLENYCHDLKSDLDLSKHVSTSSLLQKTEFPLELFLRGVSEARAAVRHLSCCLFTQIQQKPPREHEKNNVAGGGSLIIHLEALLSRTFFEDFESAGFQRGGYDKILDPGRRAEASLQSYADLKKLSWEDVLSRGTRHYSEDFSLFCDRKMSEVAGTVLGGGLWERRSWPEPILHAFFCSAKSVWLVYLLSMCDHSPVRIFRIEQGAKFDAVFMEDVVARERNFRPVKIMVAPGFFAAGGVVKCKVVCQREVRRSTTPSPSPHGGGESANFVAVN